MVAIIFATEPGTWAGLSGGVNRFCKKVLRFRTADDDGGGDELKRVTEGQTDWRITTSMAERLLRVREAR